MNAAHFSALYRQERIDSVIVGHLPRDLASAIGARVTRVFWSADTMAKQLVRHPDLELYHYDVLRPALHFGEYRHESERTAVVVFVDTVKTDSAYRLHLKATANGREIYADSFCRLGGRQHRAELRRGLPLLRAHLRI